MEKIHFYTHAPDANYGLARIRSFLVNSVPHEIHSPRPWPGDPPHVRMRWFVKRRYAGFFGAVEHPSHALSVLDSVAGNDVVTVADLIPWRHRTFYLRAGFYWIWLLYTQLIWSRALSKARRIVAISAAAKDDLDWWGARCDAIIHPTIDASLRAQPRTNGRRRDRILIVGENNPRKRWEVAIEAAAKLGKPVTWVGHRMLDDVMRPYEEFVLRRARELGVELTRIPNSSEEELVKAYKEHAVLLSPSLWEGYNLPVMEALRFNLPVVLMGRPDSQHYGRRLYGGLVPIVENWEEIPKAMRYEPGPVYDELASRLGFEDAAGHLERYLRIYESIGVRGTGDVPPAGGPPQPDSRRIANV